MRTPVRELSTSDITSTVYTISPTQVEYIAHVFGDSVADAMNMRPFAGRFREIAVQSLQNALNRARHMGESGNKMKKYLKTRNFTLIFISSDAQSIAVIRDGGKSGLRGTAYRLTAWRGDPTIRGTVTYAMKIV